ncbi:MAG: hypothetical protein GVY17_05295 [Cyanobacteria bacterium]|jgi:hypothetical protein|nr:hypothetical protein [Cyanobacteria bacterium GSL.Bin21]
MGNPKLEAANQRLKDGGVGFKIYQRGSKLSLRGMFPPQPGEEKPKQRWLSLDIYANPAGIKRAEAEARKVASAIALKEFTWGDYINLSLDPTDEIPPTIEYVSAEFEKDYFAVRGRTEKTATTWRTDYEAVFKKFVPGSHVTAEALLNIILSTEANTRTRLRACTACGAKPRARACALREIH